MPRNPGGSRGGHPKGSKHQVSVAFRSSRIAPADPPNQAPRQPSTSPQWPGVAPQHSAPLPQPPRAGANASALEHCRSCFDSSPLSSPATSLDSPSSTSADPPSPSSPNQYNARSQHRPRRGPPSHSLLPPSAASPEQSVVEFGRAFAEELLSAMRSSASSLSEHVSERVAQVMRDVQLQSRALTETLKVLRNKPDGPEAAYAAFRWLISPEATHVHGPAYAHHVLTKFSCTTLISCLRLGNLPERGLEVFDWLRASTADLNAHVYSAALSCCAASKRLDKALEIKKEVSADPSGSCRNTHVYTALMSVCEKCGECDMALSLLDEMRCHGVSSNSITMNALLSALDKGRKHDRAFEVLSTMRSEGVAPDRVSYSLVLAHCAKLGMGAEARELFEQLRASQFLPDAQMWTSLLEACSYDMAFEDVLQLFERMKSSCTPTLAAYRTLLSAARRAVPPRVGPAVELYSEMRSWRIEPCSFTIEKLISLMSSSCSTMWAQALALWQELRTLSSVKPTASTARGIISIVTTAGYAESALHVAQEAINCENIEPTAAFFDAILTTCFRSAPASVIAKINAEMERRCVAKTQHTYMALLAHCVETLDSHEGARLAREARSSSVEMSLPLYKLMMRALLLHGDNDDVLALHSELRSAGVALDQEANSLVGAACDRRSSAAFMQDPGSFRAGALAHSRGAPQRTAAPAASSRAPSDPPPERSGVRLGALARVSPSPSQQMEDMLPSNLLQSVEEHADSSNQ